MAITDALGTAAKMLGVAADIYRGLIAKGASDSKYARREYAAQNAPQSQQKPPVQANGAQDTMRQNALKALKEKAAALKLENGEVTALIGAYYNKLSTKEMTTNEICDLTNNLKKYIEEAMGAPLGTTA
jgi:hypothetical protein